MNQCAERTLARLLDVEKADTSSLESRRTYAAMHEARFAEMLRLSRSLVPSSSARVLDIGRSELTAYLSTFYRDVHSLGFDPSIDDGGHREAKELSDIPHITFDLLNAPNVGDWPQCGTFDLIMFSEVIEHLHIAPAYVFALLGSLLSSDGVLICTTPNAVSFAKRVRMLAGRNPYERLRLYARNPGHIREYTRSELMSIAADVGLVCRSHCYVEWIGHGRANVLKRAIFRLLNVYPPFRPFQILVLGPSERLAGGRAEWKFARSLGEPKAWGSRPM